MNDESTPPCSAEVMATRYARELGIDNLTPIIEWFDRPYDPKVGGFRYALAEPITGTIYINRAAWDHLDWWQRHYIVAHEVCHLAVPILFGWLAFGGHGPNWQRLMVSIGWHPAVKAPQGWLVDILASTVLSELE